MIAGGVVIGVRLWGHGGTARHPGAGAGQQPAVPGVFGVPTVTAGCPAAAVGAAAARCTRDPECWAGLVVTSGSATARSLPCARPHIWQTFAIAILPTVVRTFDQDIVGANSTVNAVCSMPVLLRSRGGAARRIPAKRWVIQVLPPDESAFDSGARAYRCVATVAGATGLRGSEFGS